MLLILKLILLFDIKRIQYVEIVELIFANIISNVIVCMHEYIVQYNIIL